MTDNKSGANPTDSHYEDGDLDIQETRRTEVQTAVATLTKCIRGSDAMRVDLAARVSREIQRLGGADEHTIQAATSRVMQQL